MKEARNQGRVCRIGAALTLFVAVLKRLICAVVGVEEIGERRVHDRARSPILANVLLDEVGHRLGLHLGHRLLRELQQLPERLAGMRHRWRGHDVAQQHADLADDERVPKERVDARPVLRVLRQRLGDEVVEGGRPVRIIVERRRGGRGREVHRPSWMETEARRLAVGHLNGRDADTPDVRRLVVATFVLAENLWRHPVARADDGRAPRELSALAQAVAHPRQDAKVRDAHLPLLGHEQIRRLDVAVDEVLAVDDVKPDQRLSRDRPDLHLGQRHASLVDHVQHGSGAQLHQQPHLVLEQVNAAELHHMVALALRQRLNLRGEHLDLHVFHAEHLGGVLVRILLVLGPDPKHRSVRALSQLLQQLVVLLQRIEADPRRQHGHVGLGGALLLDGFRIQDLGPIVVRVVVPFALRPLSTSVVHLGVDLRQRQRLQQLEARGTQVVIQRHLLQAALVSVRHPSNTRSDTEGGNGSSRNICVVSARRPREIQSSSSKPHKESRRRICEAKGPPRAPLARAKLCPSQRGPVHRACPAQKKNRGVKPLTLGASLTSGNVESS
eukprot:scaffold664_cov260-Pinguiococcus_pyrenoidosus.AAC.21